MLKNKIFSSYKNIFQKNWPYFDKNQKKNFKNDSKKILKIKIKKRMRYFLLSKVIFLF